MDGGVADPRRVGTASCQECGGTITFEKVEGRDELVALDVTNEIATRDNHQDLYRMQSDSRRVFEPVTRPGQVGQMAHSATCPSTTGGRGLVN